VRLNCVREFLTELRPVLERVAVPRHEIAVVSVDVGEGSEPVVLHLEEPIGMVEGLREAQERHGPECRRRFRADRNGAVLGAGTGGSDQRPAARSKLDRGTGQVWPSA
jgi:hypothetical protein